MLPKKMPSKQPNSHVGEYSLQNKFAGFNAREDKTLLPPNTLISPSQNVLVGTSGRISLVKGYELDGQPSTDIDSGILSNFDFDNFKGNRRNMRAGFLTDTPTLGPELITNGDFNGDASDWTLETGWTYNSNNVIYSFTSGGNLLQHGVITEVGGNYQVEFNIGGNVGTVAVTLGEGNPVYTFNAGTGNITQTMTVPVDIGDITFTPSDDFNGTITNVSVKQIISSGKLQFRYKDSDGDVTWIDLLTNLSSVRLCFCNYWDNTELIKYVLWVDGSNSIWKWNGAVTTVNFASSNTITKQGNTTWQQEGFTSSGSITINGVTATYSGGYDTDTLTGVSEDFSATSMGQEVHQDPVETRLADMGGILATFSPTVIGCGRSNQVYVGSSTSNNLYISKVNDFTDYTFTSPTRIVGEGAIIPLDAYPTKFIAQEVTAAEGGNSAYDMWISEGLSTWAVIRSTLSNDLTAETLEHIRLKTSSLQGAISERLVTKMKNHIMYVGNDNVASFVGYISYQYIPTVVDFSYPIIDDMNSYDFADASIFFHKNYAYIAVPRHSLIRIYNMTDQTKDQFSQYKAIEDVTQMPWFWESPISYPITGFYVTEDGELGGHGYTASESYLLFQGGSLNGQDITANATFAMDDKGDRTQSKASDEIWIEGYIKQNTILSSTIAGDLDTFQTSQTITVDGSDPRIVAFGGGAHSLGEGPLGSQPLGGNTNQAGTLPAWFHVAKTYPQVPFYLEQLSFSSKGIDLNWELICFGTNAKFTPEGNAAITE